MNYDVDKRLSISLFCKWIGVYFICLIVGAMNIGVFGSLLKLLAIVPVGIWLIFSHKIKLMFCTKITFLYVLFLVFSLFWTIDFSATIERIISQITFLIMIIAVSAYSYNEREILFLKRCLVYSSRVSAVVVLLSADFYEGRIFLNGIVKEDPNYLCAYFFFGVISAIVILLSREALKNKVFSMIELCIYFYIILATGSRGGVLAIIMSIIIFLLFFRNKNRCTVSEFMTKLLFVFSIGLILSIVMTYLSTEITERFTLMAIKTSDGTGRFDIWESALNAYNSSGLFRQLFGYGTASAIKVTYLFPFNHHLVYHNIYIETLIEVGLIGFCLYLLFVGSYVYLSIKNQNMFCLAILMGLVILSMSVSISVFKPYWNIMLYTIIISLAKRNKYCGGKL